MKGIDEEFIVAAGALTVVMTLLIVFFIIFAFLFQRRQFQFRQEKQALQESYAREILHSQLEIQNQTLRQVAEELHDNIGQVLSVASLHLSVLDEDLADSKQQLAVKQITGLVHSAIKDIRSLSKTLDSDTVQQFGLRESLQLELERIDRTGRFQAQLTVTGTPYPLGEQTEIVLFRMTQEALNNAMKHSGGPALTVSLDYQPNAFTLVIADDGKGFSVEEVNGRDLNHNGSGLRNLERRAKLLGGTCTITSKPNDGTRVEISVPTDSST